MLDRVDDTIVAISSPAGASVRGVIRLSGKRAFELADHVFAADSGLSLTSSGGYRRLFGQIRSAALAGLPAEVYLFRAPASYTRQDVVELHTIGSPPVLAELCDSLMVKGARQAEPGEFTARAFLAGAMDLTRVEGVAAMIHASTDSQLRASEALLHGQLSHQSMAIRDELADLLALVEAQIDFAEEPIEFASHGHVETVIGRAIEKLDRLLSDSPPMERLETLPHALIAGRPNAGKSTLFNCLTGMNRVIASATAGTTRDVITSPLTLAEGEILLLDSPGVNMAGNRRTANAEEDPGKRAEQATRRVLSFADLILWVVDVTEPSDPRADPAFRELKGRAVIMVANKMDALANIPWPAWLADNDWKYPITRISACSGAGVDGLREEISRAMFKGVETHGAYLLMLSNRQRGTLREALEALIRARQVCVDSSAFEHHAELLAMEVREAITALSLLTGEIATEELLDRIFSRFCVGK